MSPLFPAFCQSLFKVLDFTSVDMFPKLITFVIAKYSVSVITFTISSRKRHYVSFTSSLIFILVSFKNLISLSSSSAFMSHNSVFYSYSKCFLSLFSINLSSIHFVCSPGPSMYTIYFRCRFLLLVASIFTINYFRLPDNSQ